MDDLLAAAGAENVEYPLKTACCGGAHTLSDSDTSTKLVLNLLTTAEACGADVIATECPTCHTGLEMHQMRAEKVFGKKTTVKILYFTQLLGMALGLSARKVGVHENLSDSRDLLLERGLAVMATARPACDADGAARRDRRHARRGARRVGAGPRRRAAGDRRDGAGELARPPRARRRPTATVEGFRLLALHRQGARGDPSFNACRETCRELVYHRNCVLPRAPDADDVARASASARWWRATWCCSSTASWRSPASASSAARRAPLRSATPRSPPPANP